MLIIGRSSMMMVWLNGYAWLMKNGRSSATHHQRRYKIVDLMAFLHFATHGSQGNIVLMQVATKIHFKDWWVLINIFGSYSCHLGTMVSLSLWYLCLFGFTLKARHFIVNVASMTSNQMIRPLDCFVSSWSRVWKLPCVPFSASAHSCIWRNSYKYFK